MWKPLFIITCLIHLWGISAQANPLQERMSGLAKYILDNTNNQSVTIDLFSPIDMPESSSATGLEQLLKQELLIINKNAVSPSAKYLVKGEYGYSRSRNQAMAGKIVKIELQIIEREFNEKLTTPVQLEASIDDFSNIASLLQLNGHVKDNTPEHRVTKSEQKEEIQKLQVTPEFYLHGTNHNLISAHSKSKYSVELRTAHPNPKSNLYSEFLPQMIEPQVFTDKKLIVPFVKIEKDEIYEPWITNNDSQPVAVKVQIDGLSTFHFSKDRDDEGRPRFEYVIIQPGETNRIPGWHQSIKGSVNYLKFKVVGYGLGAATEAGVKSRSQVGSIHIQFSHCHPLKDGDSPRSGNETGFGPPEKIIQTPVRYEMEPPLEFVTLRYTRPQQ
jgi:hypothetical protein